MEYATDNLQSFAQDLGPRLEKMNFKQKMYFTLSCVERILPYYMHYSQISGLNGVDELAATVESYWGLSDFPAGALKKAEIPPNWETSDRQVGVVSGEVINLLMNYLNEKDNRIIQHISHRMILIGELLTVKLGENHVGDEITRQEAALDDAENMDAENPEELNGYITGSIQIAYNESSKVIVKLH